MTALTTPPAPPLARAAAAEHRPRADPAGPAAVRGEPARRGQGGHGRAIASLPISVPAGLGNTAPSDVFLAAAIFVSALWFSSRRQPMRFPYMFPVGLSILAGALASTVAYSHAYVSVGGGLVTLIQDAFLLAWASRSPTSAVIPHC